MPQKLTLSDIEPFLEKQKLGYVATVSKDNTPNLSPKGTVLCWKGSYVIFADIRSPDTITNLSENPHLEINVVDPILRKGYRIKGKGKILKDGNEFQEILDYYKSKGIKSKINSIVLVNVDHIKEVTSPLYDLGYSENQIKDKWRNHYLSD